MVLNVVLFFPSSSRHSVSGFFKQSIAHSPRCLVCFPNASSHCSEEGVGSSHSFPRPHQHTRRDGVMGRRTIWNVPKSGRALHTETNSDIAEHALPAGSSRIPISVSCALDGRGAMTMSSVSLGNAVTDSEIGSGQPPLSSRGLTILSRLRDTLTHTPRGIANRLTFESWMDARD